MHLNIQLVSERRLRAKHLPNAQFIRPCLVPLTKTSCRWVERPTRITLIPPVAANVFAQQRVLTTVIQASKYPPRLVNTPAVSATLRAAVRSGPVRMTPALFALGATACARHVITSSGGRFACFSRLQTGRRRGVFAEGTPHLESPRSVARWLPGRWDGVGSKQHGKDAV